MYVYLGYINVKSSMIKSSFKLDKKLKYHRHLTLSDIIIKIAWKYLEIL